MSNFANRWRTSSTDAEVTSAEGASDASLDALYRRYAPVVYRRSMQLLGNEDDALDAVQDVFLKLQGRLDSFRGESSSLTWIYSVTTNHCLNVLRSRRTRERVFDAVARVSQPSGAPAPSESIAGRQLLERLVARCSERQLQVLVYHVFDDMTQAEVAGQLGISERAVRKILHKLRDEASKAGLRGALRSGDSGEET